MQQYLQKNLLANPPTFASLIYKQKQSNYNEHSSKLIEWISNGVQIVIESWSKQTRMLTRLINLIMERIICI